MTSSLCPILATASIIRLALNGFIIDSRRSTGLMTLLSFNCWEILSAYRLKFSFQKVFYELVDAQVQMLQPICAVWWNFHNYDIVCCHVFEEWFNLVFFKLIKNSQGWEFTWQLKFLPGGFQVWGNMLHIIRHFCLILLCVL